MDREAALTLLELAASSTEPEILQRLQEMKSKYEQLVAKAATLKLKGAYRARLDSYIQAGEVLLAARPGEADVGNLPVADPDYSTPPPVSPPPQTASPQTHLPIPPTPQFPVKPIEHKGTTPLPPPPPKVDLEDEEPAEIKPPRPPLPWWVKGLIGLGILLAICGLYWVLQAYWLQPKKTAEQRQTGLSVLNSVLPSVQGLEAAARGKSTPTDQTHAKARALSWAAVALGATGHIGEAGSLVVEVENLVTPMTGLASMPDRCRLIAAMAGGRGDATGATAALVALQRDREAELGIRPQGANTAPLAASKHQDEARRSIAISQARQGQALAAMGTVNSIQDDERACQAMQEVARQHIATGAVSEANMVLQTIETRAKKIADPSARTPMLTFVAAQTRVILGAEKAKKYIQDAIGSASTGGGTTNSGYSAMEARKVLGDALLMPSRLRLALDTPDEYRKRLDDVFAAASNLKGSSGALTQQADFANRARIYAVLAVAWMELGSRWFTGDAAQRAQDMIDKALAAAEQAKPLAESSTSAQLVKDSAIATVVAALAEMRDFERAGQLLGRMVESAPVGEAAEAVAYQMGLAGMHEEGRVFVQRVQEGEPRCRAAVALLYGLHQLPLEKWW
jgi:tetratricopeptide (TPR) repeat protein